MGVYQDDRWSLFFDVFARRCPLFCSGVKRGSMGTPHLERSLLYFNKHLYNCNSVKSILENGDNGIRRFRLYHVCRTPHCPARATSIREGSADTGIDLEIEVRGQQHINNNEGSLVPSEINCCICSSNEYMNLQAAQQIVETAANCSRNTHNEIITSLRDPAITSEVYVSAEAYKFIPTPLGLRNRRAYAASATRGPPVRSLAEWPNLQLDDPKCLIPPTNEQFVQYIGPTGVREGDMCAIFHTKEGIK